MCISYDKQEFIKTKGAKGAIFMFVFYDLVILAISCQDIKLCREILINSQLL
jgi:hypothetical protein